MFYLKRFLWLIILALAVGVFCGPPAMAQMSAADKMVAPGNTGAGGGASTATDKMMTGLVAASAVGVSISADKVIAAGSIAAAYTSGSFLSAIYAGNLIETVTPGNRVLKVAINGGNGAISGTVYYRQGGAVAYSSAAMSLGTGDTLNYTMAAANFGLRGVEYYFSVMRGTSSTNVGSSTSPFVFISALTNAQAQRPVPVPNLSYRIISVPIAITGANSTSAVFVDDFGAYDKAQWRLGSYRSSTGNIEEHPSARAVDSVHAYWLIKRTGSTYGVAGNSRRPNFTYNGQRYFRVEVDSGWMQLANPLPFDVTWSEILIDTAGVVVAGHPAAIIDNVAYSYSGSNYTSATTLDAWEGVFVKIKRRDVSFLFPYHEAGTKSAPKPLAAPMAEDDPGDWAIELTLISGHLFDDGNLIGVRSDASDDYDEYDYADPPPAPEAPRLSLTIPGDYPEPMRTDFRAPFEGGATWNMDFSDAPERKLVINGVAGIPASMNGYLRLDNGKTVDLAEGAEVILPEEVKTATVVIGTREYVEDQLPRSYDLRQNYPNPFNPTTTISFALPETAEVKLEVYNILGQRVRVLIDRSMDAGEYMIQWNGDDESGHAVSSGIYFYRIAANHYRQCRKMALLK